MQTAVMVLDEEVPRITAEAFTAQYLNDWGADLPIAQGDEEDLAHPSSNCTFLVEVEGGLLGIVQQSAPFAGASFFAETATLGAMWPRGKPFNVTHPAHVSVVCNSTALDAKQASHLVTQALASLVALVDSAHAVIWLTARHPVEPSLLRKIALDPRVEGRVPLWVSVETVTAVDGSPAGRTEGMVEFGHPEFEVAEADESAADLVTFLLRLASFSVSRGAIPPGQTVASPSGPRRIVVGDSMFAEDTIVHRVLPARLSRGLPRDPEEHEQNEARIVQRDHGPASVQREREAQAVQRDHDSATTQRRHGPDVAALHSEESLAAKDRAGDAPAAPRKRGFWSRLWGG